MYYRINGFNKGCTKCSLGCGKAVPGQSEVDFSRVALIIISAYPGQQEQAQNLSLAPKPVDGDRHRSKSVGAGEFMRLSLGGFFDTDPTFPQELKPLEEHVYFTNALKCSPQRGRDKITITGSMIKTCRNQWLTRELSQFHPKTPILLAGSEAVKSLLGQEGGVYASRRKVFYLGEHPTLVTFNPIEAERGLIKEVDSPETIEENLLKLFSRIQNPGKKVGSLVRSHFWRPTPFLSVPWHWKKDMESVKELTIKFYREYM